MNKNSHASIYNGTIIWYLSSKQEFNIFPFVFLFLIKSYEVKPALQLFVSLYCVY